MFRIDIPESLVKYRDDPDYLDELNESLSIDGEYLDDKMFLFTQQYWQTLWTIQIGDDVHTFYLDDLLFFWEDLGRGLSAIVEGSKERIFLDLHEYDFSMCVTSGAVPEDLTVQLVGGNFTGMKPSRVYTISRSEFLAELRRFARAMIGLLVEYHLIEADDTHAAEYLKRIGA